MKLSRGRARQTDAGDRPLADLDARLGITRIARITGLDRLGLEVACAVRPGGHILQVTSGKGESWEAAAMSARMEAAELWAAEQLPLAGFEFGTYAEMSRASPGAPILRLDQIEPDGVWADPDSVRVAWVVAEEVMSQTPGWVPAWAVHCPPAGGPLLGPALAPWTSNGMGAHPLMARALEHALYEAAERDQLARALPAGWTPVSVRRALLSKRGLGRLAPRVLEWQQRAATAGFELHLFDLTLRQGEGALAIPLAAAMLFDTDEGPVPLAAGYAAAPVLGEALMKAFMEAAQSRLTDIHGAREDIEPPDREAVQELRKFCRRSARREAFDGPRAAVTPLTPRALLARLTRAGFRQVFAAGLSGDGPEGLSVVKVLIPGFARSRLL